MRRVRFAAMPGHPAAERQSEIRDKLASGALSSAAPSQISSGFGTGHRCGICEYRILPTDVECRCAFALGPAMRMHLECFAEWRRQTAAARLPAPWRTQAGAP